MFDKKREAIQSRHMEALQKRCERIAADYEALRTEKEALEKELNLCREKLRSAEEAEAEFMREIDRAKQIRERYEKAYDDLKIIKSKYSEEVAELIKQIGR